MASAADELHGDRAAFESDASDETDSEDSSFNPLPPPLATDDGDAAAEPPNPNPNAGAGAGSDPQIGDMDTSSPERKRRHISELALGQLSTVNGIVANFQHGRGYVLSFSYYKQTIFFPPNMQRDTNTPSKIMGNCFIGEEKEEIKTPSYPSPLKLHEAMSISKALKPILEAGSETGVLRIKMIVKKQELKDMIKVGVISIADGVDFSYQDRCIDWKPSLESIPEGNDLS
ncbi:hypothetical protein J5N97_021366 [Dioscorea zingiberensis]|uniref:Uncharacterized protein n=1 Tax=Dioscorea zingiberensis TaxID=325984 RepID=A0A9D5CIX4_9LILI|nr:hypothetical protein J5N97_021366 [Dioscorea zingiberensis]